MDPALRIVTQLPLTELWNEAGVIAASWSRDLSLEGVRQLLQSGPVRFVVADVGHKLLWIPEAACFEFWKVDVRSRLPGADSVVKVDDFSGGWFYFAAEWSSLPDREPIVVLSKVH